MDCEMCGRGIRGRPRRIMVEGVIMTVCSECYEKTLGRKITESRASSISTSKRPLLGDRKKTHKSRSRRIEVLEYEVVPEYASIIRKARESKGWTQAALAQRVRESGNTIRRIEAGRLVPSIDLARKLEKVLKVRLLQPVIEESSQEICSKSSLTLTLGDVVEIRRRKDGK